jgi:hypothetical protein
MKVFYFLILAFVSNLNAEILLGTGLSSQTQGRHSPIFYSGYEFSDRSITFSSVGVSTEIYYQSSMQLNYFFMQKEYGKFAFGKVKIGPGLSVFYSEFGYREDKDAKSEEVSDLNLGPSLRGTWNILDSAFISIESMYGIRGLYGIVMSFQTTTTLVLGVSF